MMTLNNETSIERARRREGDQIKRLLQQAAEYLDAVEGLLDEAEATQQEEGNGA